MSDDPEEMARRLVRSLDYFADEMQALGIHVGIAQGLEGRCVTCGEPWPCDQRVQER